MKTIFLSICIAFISTFTFAQLKEGSVSYSIEMNSDDPAMQAQLAMFQGSKMEMMFSSDFSRIEASFGMLMNMTTVINNKKQVGLMLMSGMMGKKAIKLNEKDIKSEVDVDYDPSKVVITSTDETKQILGYNCRKFIITMEEGIELFYWTTSEINVNKPKNKYFLNEVEGYPLAFETSTMGMKMSFVATAFNNSLKGIDTKKMFDTAVPDGYEIITLEDLQKMGMQ